MAAYAPGAAAPILKAVCTEPYSKLACNAAPAVHRVRIASAQEVNGRTKALGQLQQGTSDTSGLQCCHS